jgi:hypothetical protein
MVMVVRNVLVGTGPVPPVLLPVSGGGDGFEVEPFVSLEVVSVLKLSVAVPVELVPIFVDKVAVLVELIPVFVEKVAVFVELVPVFVGKVTVSVPVVFVTE